MTRSNGRIAAFLIGAVPGAVLWLWLSGQSRVQPISPSTTPIVDSHPDTPWTPDNLDRLLATLSQEGLSASDRLEAAAKLSEIPVDSIPTALEKVTSPEDYELSFPAKLLLVRWAGIDGEAAANWAWHRASSPNVWQYAFDQIGPAWAWHDSRAFGLWVTGTATYNPGIDSPVKDLSSGHPVVNATLLESAAGWLIRDQPRLAFEVRKKINYGVNDLKLLSGIETAPQAQEALMAFESLDQLFQNPTETSPSEDREEVDPSLNRDSPDKREAMGILQRWKQIDPADFGNSKYASWVPDAPVSVSSPAERFADLPANERSVEADRISSADLPYGRAQRVGSLLSIINTWIEIDPQQCIDWAGSSNKDEFSPKAGLLAIAFDAWNSRHLGQNPDQSGWPPERVRAWADLQALRQALHR